VLFVAAGLLNPLCLALSPLAVIPLVIYPYAKRFTNFPHYVLALAQAVAPVGRVDRDHRHVRRLGPAWVLGVAVGLWIGGFDIIYACQDAEIDRQIGVHSTPARYGVRAALHLSTVTHVVTFALFVWFGQLVGLGWLWWVGLALTAAAFVYQHVVIKPDDLSKVNRAFFTANDSSASRCSCSPCSTSRGRGGCDPTPWVVGVSGASGTPYAKAVIGALLDAVSRRT
jgi:4-hydroxybenzoate polyprenyltransferase